MLELWLIRHAESLGNLDGTEADTCLSPRGRRQAEALASALVGERFDEAVSSPLQRAQETATIALPGHPLTVEPRLREFCPEPEVFVDASKLDLARIEAMLRPDPSAPRPEKGREFMARVREWIAELPVSGKIIVFSHFGVVRECLGALLPARPQRIAQASISRIRVGQGANRIIVVDDCRHLDRLRLEA